MFICQESCVQLNLILYITIHLKNTNVEKESIFQQFRFLRQTIILDFDSMKPNMSANLKYKENKGSSCLFIEKTTFSVKKKKSEKMGFAFGSYFFFFF